MKTTKRNKTPHYESEPTIKTPKLPGEDEIRRHAHQLFLKRGGIPGKEMDDWLQAERELKQGSGSKAES